MEINGCNVANTGDWNLRSADSMAKSDAGQNGNLVSSIQPIDIEAGIGFSVARCLRLLQRVRKLNAILFHLRKNVVASAIHNSVNSLDAVSRQRLRDCA